jgi:hypothetical protein
MWNRPNNSARSGRQLKFRGVLENSRQNGGDFLGLN